MTVMSWGLPSASGASSASSAAAATLAAGKAYYNAGFPRVAGSVGTLGSGFNWASGVAADAAGNVFVADRYF